MNRLTDKQASLWVKAQVQSNIGHCWVMDCPEPSHIVKKGDIEFCRKHSDRFLDVGLAQDAQ